MLLSAVKFAQDERLYYYLVGSSHSQLLPHRLCGSVDTSMQDAKGASGRRLLSGLWCSVTSDVPEIIGLIALLAASRSLFSQLPADAWLQ